MLALLALALPLLQDPGLTEAQRRLFRLIDRFDRQDALHRPFIRVATGVTRTWSLPRYRYGFLLSRGHGLVTVRYLDLETERLPPSPKHPPVSWKRVDLRDHAREVVRRLPQSNIGRFSDLASGSCSWCYPQAYAVLVARACARREHLAEVHAIWKRLDKGAAIQQVGSMLADVVCFEFSDKSLSRAELLARHKQWLESFPGNHNWEAVQARARKLETMLAEDEHRAATKRERDVTPGEAMHDLVGSLRNEFHAMYELASGRSTAKSTCPAARIQKAGFVAVPALLSALADDELTRVVDVRTWGLNPSVLTVGSVAEELLRSISGLGLSGEQAWHKWWRSVLAIGERATFVDIVSRRARSGGWVSAPAKRLIERWPDGIEDVIRITKRTRRWRRRVVLIAVVGRVKSARATSFLHDELENGPRPSTRLAAAQHLLERGRPAGIGLLVRWWTLGRPLMSFDLSNPTSALGSRYERLTELLLFSGDLRGVLPVLRRGCEWFGVARTTLLEGLRQGRLAELFERSPERDRAALAREIEHTLIALLDDTECDRGEWAQWRDREVPCLDARTCDYVACVLAARWPERYRFDIDTTTTGRDRAILAIKNAWRATAGQPLLPVPEPLPKLADPDTVRRCVVESKLGEVPKPLLEHAKRLEGTTLAPSALIEPLVSGREHLPDGGDLLVRAERPRAGTGIVLVWEIRTPDVRYPGAFEAAFGYDAPAWACEVDFEGDNAGPVRSSGDTAELAKCKKLLARAFAFPAGKGFELRLRLRRPPK